MTAPSPAGPMHVAFAIDAGYLPWCATAALSCADHADGAELQVHVLHDGSVTPTGPVVALEDLLARQGANVRWHSIEDRRIQSLTTVDRFGDVVWLRFLLPELLPQVTRVLYLDADTLVTDRLGPLFDVDLRGAAIGAVANVAHRDHYARLRALGLQPTDLLNSGVLLMDLERMRADGTTDALFATAAAHGDSLRWPDQDTLNIVLRGRWHRLDPRWNTQNSFWDWPGLASDAIGQRALEQAISAPGIVHFEGPTLCKPWHAVSVHPWRERYWETLRRTPWSNLTEEDLTWATRALRHLPRPLRTRSYRRLVRWRARFGPARRRRHA